MTIHEGVLSACTCHTTEYVHDMQEFDHSMRYDKISETTRIYIRSEAGATSVVDAVLCGRFNEIFDKQHLPWVSAVQPTIPRPIPRYINPAL